MKLMFIPSPRVKSRNPSNIRSFSILPQSGQVAQHHGQTGLCYGSASAITARSGRTPSTGQSLCALSQQHTQSVDSAATDMICLLHQARFARIVHQNRRRCSLMAAAKAPRRALTIGVMPNGVVLTISGEENGMSPNSSSACATNSAAPHQGPQVGDQVTWPVGDVETWTLVCACANA